jgi:SPFH domain / Band 7 family
MAGILVPLIGFALILGLLALRFYGGWPTDVTLLEYQRAILFRRGLPVREVGTGRHRILRGVEKLIILDTRPIQVSYENQGVTLQDGSGALYSFSGTARIRDARKALYSAGNFGQVPAFLLLCCARFVVNGSTAAQLKTNKDALTEQIINRAKPRLAAAGFELLSFRLTQTAVTQRAPE